MKTASTKWSIPVKIHPPPKKSNQINGQLKTFSDSVSKNSVIAHEISVKDSYLLVQKKCTTACSSSFIYLLFYWHSILTHLIFIIPAISLLLTFAEVLLSTFIGNTMLTKLGGGGCQKFRYQHFSAKCLSCLIKFLNCTSSKVCIL